MTMEKKRVALVTLSAEEAKRAKDEAAVAAAAAADKKAKEAEDYEILKQKELAKLMSQEDQRDAHLRAKQSSTSTKESNDNPLAGYMSEDRDYEDQPTEDEDEDSIDGEQCEEATTKEEETEVADMGDLISAMTKARPAPPFAAAVDIAERIARAQIEENGFSLDPEDDPNDCRFVDPYPDVCCFCKRPSEGEGGKCLVSCYTDYSNIKCCGKWFHPTCIGLRKPPSEKFDFLCQKCTNEQLSALGLRKLVSKRGYNVPREEEEEEEDAKPAAKDDTGSDDESLYDDSDDNVEKKKPKPRKKTPKSAAKDDTQGDNANKPKFQARRKTRKKKKPKKIPPVKKASPVVAKRRVPSRLRETGMPPTSEKQQVDVKTRVKMEACFPYVETLQQMTIPASRTDGFDRTLPDNEERFHDEKRFPHVVHMLGCFTEQAPNDKSKSCKWLRTPELRLLVNSKSSKQRLKESFSKLTYEGKEQPFKFKVFTTQEAYLESFRSTEFERWEEEPKEEEKAEEKEEADGAGVAKGDTASKKKTE